MSGLQYRDLGIGSKFFRIITSIASRGVMVCPWLLLWRGVVVGLFLLWISMSAGSCQGVSVLYLFVSNEFADVVGLSGFSFSTMCVCGGGVEAL